LEEIRRYWRSQSDEYHTLKISLGGLAPILALVSEEANKLPDYNGKKARRGQVETERSPVTRHSCALFDF
jgi:hypothetical protein